MRQLLELYKEWRGYEPVAIEHLAGAGSNRAYCRMTDKDGQSVIGCIGTSRDENHAFIYLAQHFQKRQLNVARHRCLMPSEADERLADAIPWQSRNY